MAKKERRNTTEFYVDDAGEYRWRRLAPNGQIIGDSAESFKKPLGAYNNVVSNGHLCDVIRVFMPGKHTFGNDHRRKMATRMANFLNSKPCGCTVHEPCAK